MKKIIALLISVIMILGVMPLNAFAAETISTVKIGDISAPVPGEKPDYVATYGRGYNFTTKFDGLNTKFGIAWVDVTNGQKTLKPTDTFVEGHIYRVAVVVVAEKGYSFSKADNDTSTVLGFINGNKGKVYGVSGFNAGEYAGILYTFEACSYNIVNSVAVTNLDVPASGEKFDFTANTADKGYFVNSIYWKDVTANKNMNENDVAVAGHKYEVEIWLRVNDAYRLKVDGDGCPDVTAKIGAYNATVITSVSDTVVGITDNYIVPDDIITVTVSGIDAPVAGAKADTEATCGSGYQIAKIDWVDTTGEYKDYVYGITEFEAGREYTVQVTLTTIGNYRFVMDGPYNDVSGKINNNSAIVYGSNSSTEVAIGYEFSATEKAAPTVISTVYVNGIDAPEYGKAPDTEGTCGEGYEITEIVWVDSTGEYKDYVYGITEFEVGHEYTVQITLKVKDGYEYLTDGYYNEVTGEINMQPAIEYGTSSVTELTIGYEFPAVAEPDHTHSYTSVVTPPTCKDKGYTTHTCECGDSYKDTYVDETEKHTPVVVPGKPATKTETGLTDGEKCSICDKALKEQKEIPMLSDDADNILIGDVNKDGKINAIDARAALRIGAQLDTPTDYQKIAADYNKDGKVNAIDARAILRKGAQLDP